MSFFYGASLYIIDAFIHSNTSAPVGNTTAVSPNKGKGKGPAMHEHMDEDREEEEEEEDEEDGDGDEDEDEDEEDEVSRRVNSLSRRAISRFCMKPAVL